jgi:mannitol-1-phosphate 5-dehydrogenase
VISDAHHELPYDAGAAKATMPEISGLRPSGNFKAEMERKLFTHNLGHASLAYLGKLRGYAYVHEGFEDPSLSAVFDGALEETKKTKKNIPVGSRRKSTQGYGGTSGHDSRTP